MPMLQVYLCSHLATDLREPPYLAASTNFMALWERGACMNCWGLKRASTFSTWGFSTSPVLAAQITLL